MTPTLPDALRGDLPFAPGPRAIAAAAGNLMVCRTRSGHRAVFIPELGPAEGLGVAGQERHLFLKNLALFAADGRCLRKARRELVPPSSTHDLERGESGGDGEILWDCPNDQVAQVTPIGGATIALLELEAIASPAAAFVPTSPGPRFINHGSFIQGFGAHDPASGAWMKDAGGDVYFLAPLYLPHRASLLAAELYIADHSDVDGCDISARLDRIDARSTVVELARVRSQGARGRQGLVHAGLIGHTVDNLRDAFHLHVTWSFPPTPNQQDLRLYGARTLYLPREPRPIGGS